MEQCTTAGQAEWSVRRLLCLMPVRTSPAEVKCREVGGFLGRTLAGLLGTNSGSERCGTENQCAFPRYPPSAQC